MSGMFPVTSFPCICYRTEDYHCVSVSHLFGSPCLRESLYMSGLVSVSPSHCAFCPAATALSILYPIAARHAHMHTVHALPHRTAPATVCCRHAPLPCALLAHAASPHALAPPQTTSTLPMAPTVIPATTALSFLLPPRSLCCCHHPLRPATTTSPPPRVQASPTAAHPWSGLCPSAAPSPKRNHTFRSLTAPPACPSSSPCLTLRVYSDAIATHGFAHELANYSKYSGMPTEGQVYEYAKTINESCPHPSCLLTSDHNAANHALLNRTHSSHTASASWCGSLTTRRASRPCTSSVSP